MMSSKNIPLCVDLDGTLIKSNVLVESIVLLVKKHPFFLFVIFFWFLKGKAYAKRRIAEHVSPDVRYLPYNHELIQRLRVEHSNSRTLILVTATHQTIAEEISKYLGLFSQVFATQGDVNLKGDQKADLLLAQFGEKGFDYAGDAFSDLKIWKHSRKAWGVNLSGFVLAQLKKVNDDREIITPRSGFLKNLIQEIRVYQWSKNLILLVPLVMAHKVMEGKSLFISLVAFFSFNLYASSAYILNDLLDLESDRAHSVKMNRPLASGDLSIEAGVILWPILLAVGMIVSWKVSPEFFLVLLAYWLLAMGYSTYFKKLLLVDVVVLAGLYTMRLFAGGVAVQVPISSWLMAFSVFFFLSMALVKRYSESSHALRDQKVEVKGRGYLSKDVEHLGVFGIVTGVVSVLVLALYANSPEVTALYEYPKILWGFCPLFFYWIGRIWILTYRGDIGEDPLLFATKDLPTYVVIGLILTLMFFAMPK